MCVSTHPCSAQRWVKFFGTPHTQAHRIKSCCPVKIDTRGLPYLGIGSQESPRPQGCTRLSPVYLVNLVQVNLPHSPRKSGAGSHRSGKATSGTAAISGILAFRQHRDSCASQACGSQLRHHFWRQCVHSRVRVLHVVCSIEVFPAHVRPGHTLVHPAIRKPAALPLRNRSWESTAD